MVLRQASGVLVPARYKRTAVGTEVVLVVLVVAVVVVTSKMEW